MKHFAEIDEDSRVLRILVLSDEDASGAEPEESEPRGQDYLASLGLEGTWVQTSPGGNFRKKHAWIGDTYDAVNDVFISPQPLPSWTLDENFDWQPPIPCPTDGKPYDWDETTLSWVEVPTTP